MTRAFAILLLACVWSGCAAPRAPVRAGAAPSAKASAVASQAPDLQPVKLLAWNDFHGQLSPRTAGDRQIGGAAVLAAYLRAAETPHTIFVHAGDHVGASPANSALLQDEPAIALLNVLANAACTYERRDDPACNTVGTLGNHEFDEGQAELLRLLHGGNHPSGPFLESPWRGARFPYVCANVLRTDTQQPLLPPYVIKRVGGVAIGFIGAVLHSTPTVVRASGVAGLEFIDEADAINRYVPELKQRGVRAIVVTIHQGLEQTPYAGPTRADAAASGALSPVLERLDDEIDVVVSGHTHEFTNALLPNAHGTKLLVTQAVSAGVAFADIDLTLDRRTGDVVSKTARIVSTWHDEGPGRTPDPAASAIVAEADARVAGRVSVVVAQAAEPVRRAQNAAGESALGSLIADAQRAAVKADFAAINPGGIRADIEAGPVTWGTLYSVQPFRNPLIVLTLTGQQLYDLLNQQWGGEQPNDGRFLQISGFGYSWDASQPIGARVIEIHDARGRPLDRKRRYTLVVNAFLAEGGDGFSVLLAGADRRAGPIDLDAFADYLSRQPQPIAARVSARMVRR